MYFHYQKSSVARDSLRSLWLFIKFALQLLHNFKGETHLKNKQTPTKLKSFCLQPAHNNQQTCWNSRQPPKTRCFSTTTWFFNWRNCFFCDQKTLSVSHSPATDCHTRISRMPISWPISEFFSDRKWSHDLIFFCTSTSKNMDNSQKHIVLSL